MNNRSSQVSDVKTCIEYNVEKIDDDNERLTVMVSIFGRMTPVELSFNQIK